MEVLSINKEISSVQKEWFRQGRLKTSDPEIFVQSGILLIALVIFQDYILNLIKMFPSIFSPDSRINVWTIAQGTFFIVLIFLQLFILFDFLFRNSEILPSSEKYIFDQTNDVLNEFTSAGNRSLCKLNEINEIVILIEIEGKIMDGNPDDFGFNIPDEWSLANSIYKVEVHLNSGETLTLEKNSIPILSKLETQDKFRLLISKTNKSIQLIRKFLDLEHVNHSEYNDPEREEWLGLSSQRLEDAYKDNEEEYATE